jgi:superfamily II DNA or RNA helicase
LPFRNEKVGEKLTEQPGEEKVGLAQLNQERAKFLLDQLIGIIPYVKELTGMTDDARKAVEQQVAEFALSIKTSKLDKDQLEAFFKKPYYLEPVRGRPDSWYLIIPKFVDIQIGWMDRSTESYNCFIINRYMDWLGEIPEAIKRQLNWKAPPELILDGEEIHGPKGALEYAWQKYRPFLHDRDDTKIRINPKRAFDLIASMIKDGVLPFNIKPVDSADFVERKCDWQLRDYQLQAWNEFKRFSAIGVYYPPGTGKTVIALWAMTHLKPPHLVVVPTRLLREQWLERIQTHTDLQPGEYEVMTYQSAIKKASDKQWTTLIVDEEHHLPANCYSEDTMVLTENGWKLHADWNGEKIAVYDPTSREIRLEKPLNFVQMHYKGPMVNIVSDTTDIFVTPNHRMLIRWNNKAEWRVLEAQKLVGKTYWQMKVSDLWQGEPLGTDTLVIPQFRNKYGYTRTVDLNLNDLMTLIGYYLTEGSTNKFTTRIHQSAASRHLQEIKTLFSSLNLQVRETITQRTRFGKTDSLVSFEIPGVGFRDWTVTTCGLGAYGKHIPPRIKNLPVAQLRPLFEAMMNGDGSWNPSGRSGVYYTVSKQLAYDFAEVALKLGYAIKIGTQAETNPTSKADFLYKVNIVQRTTRCINAHHRTSYAKEVNYDGNIFCFQTSTGFYVTMRNGKPAIQGNTFVKLALLKRKYTLGLSATPFREDGREEYIFALSGKPVGLSWEYFKKLNLIKSPTCHVWIVKNFEAKLKRLDSLLQADMRTIIFSDAIEVGKTIAARFSKPDAIIPFVYGATKDNMETILANRVVVVSRVGDEGMSLPDIERVIEVSWLGGSRRQELQRTTRLLHSQVEEQEQENHVLMTLEEYLRDRKRLFSIMDKGFKVVLHREGVSEKVIEDGTMKYQLGDHAPRSRQSTPSKQASALEPVTATPPLLVSPGQSGTYTSLPGVQRIMSLMNKKQKQFYTLLLDHDGEWFSRKTLPMLLGYAGETGAFQSTLDFRKLVERGWIEQKREGNTLSYRTNMKGKMGG